MRRTSLWVIILFLLSVLTACSTQSDLEPASGSLDLAMELDNEFRIDEEFLSDFSFGKPSGLLFQNDMLFVVDSSDNCIYVFNIDGQHLQTIGSTGNGELQFINPSAITYRDGLYYIVDSKNLRIQILNDDFTYHSERLLPDNPADTPYIDIAVDESGDAYVTTEYIQHKYAHIFKISETGLSTQIGEKLIGYVTNDSNDVYMANMLELLDGGARTGANFLYTVSGDSLTQTFEIPYKYMPEDFVANIEYFFFYSWARSTLDKFSSDGKYIETLFQFDSNSDIRYMCSNSDQSIFFLSSPNQGNVYCIRSTSLESGG